VPEHLNQIQDSPRVIKLEEHKAKADAEHRIHDQPHPEDPNIPDVCLDSTLGQDCSLVKPAWFCLRHAQATISWWACIMWVSFHGSFELQPDRTPARSSLSLLLKQEQWCNDIQLW